MPDTPGQQLDQLAAAGLLRHLTPYQRQDAALIAPADGPPLTNFSSNDYLGLASHPTVLRALHEGVDRFGAGAGASRLVCGSLTPHHQLEAKIALLKSAPAALTFSSGFATALGTLPALLDSQDVVILDKLAHACLIDAAKLSGAALRSFPHNDIERLADRLRWAAARRPRRIMIVVESVYSMDGDLAPLADLIALARQFGAWLLVDEAHAFGILGPGGRGLLAGLDLSGITLLQMGTLSKAVGLSGGFLAAPQPVIDLLINRARSFIYSTAPPPALAHAASAALDLITSQEGDRLRTALQHNIAAFRSLRPANSPAPPGASPIIPHLLGDSRAALDLATHLRHSGFLVPAIRYPTVPRGTARLRITLSALHQPHQIEGLVDRLPPTAP